MKKTILLSAFVVAGSLSAQDFIAGWGFESFDGAGSPTIDFNGVSSVDSYYSSFDANGVGSGATGYGTASWTGDVEVFAGNLSLNTSTGSATIGSSASKNILGVEQPAGPDALYQDLKMGFTSTGATISFTADVSSRSSDYEDWTLSFAGSGTGTVDVKFNGTSLGTATFTGSETVFSFDSTSLSSDAGTTGVFLLTANTVTSNLLFDNVQLGGTAVPEPSTYAAILGVLALGFAAYRRRRA